MSNKTGAGAARGGKCRNRLMRFFNTEGPVRPDGHYAIAPLDRMDVDELLGLIHTKRHLVLHAPRQTGKTFTLIALRNLLNSGEAGDFRYVDVNVEVGQVGRDDVAGCIEPSGLPAHGGATDDVQDALTGPEPAGKGKEGVRGQDSTFRGGCGKLAGHRSRHVRRVPIMVPNQVPAAGEKVLDHIAHWVPDLEAAGETLASLGFCLTPWSEQHAAAGPGARLAPVGSANRCIMLGSGYLEVLAPLAPTPIGRELQAGIDRYVGVHLLAFGASDTEAEQARLEAGGFPQRPPVALRREVETEAGETATLRFTVGRAKLGSMAEGRVQFLTHHTPEHLWQPRWLAHPNTAEALAEVWIVTADLDEAADRYAGYLGRSADRGEAGAAAVTLSRGRVSLFTPEAFRARLPNVAIPALPFIAGYGLAVREPGQARRMAERTAGATVHRLGPERFAASLPGNTGGTLLFSRSGRLDPPG